MAPAPAGDVPPAPEPAAGLREAAHRLVSGLVDIGRTRLELAAVELEEERLRLARLALRATFALFLLGVGLLLAVAWLVLWSAPEHRLAVLAALCLAFLAAGALAAWRWHRLAEARPALLATTLAELRADAQALRGGDAP